MTDTMSRLPLRTLCIAFLLFGFFSQSQAQDISYIKATLDIPANAGIMSETCGNQYFLVIERDPDNVDTILIFISDNGVAQLGVDYNFPQVLFHYNCCQVKM